MSDLKALIEAVGAGDKSIPWSSWACAVGVDNVFTADDACRGSMDAALALFKELLPGYGVKIIFTDGIWFILVFKDGFMDDYDDWVDNEDPARALLLATLKAVEAQQK